MALQSFELTPTSDFRLDLTVWTLRRRPHNILDRWDGSTYRRVMPLSAGPVEVAVSQPDESGTAKLRVSLEGQSVNPEDQDAVTLALERLLGLNIDMMEFHQFAAHHLQLWSLADRFRGMRPPRLASVFESAINAIACQQVSLTLGIHLLNRLAVAFSMAMGEPGNSVYSFPRPMDLAGLIPADLRQLGFSLQRGRAIIELAQSILDGHTDLEQFAALPDDEAVTRLRAFHGLGRWSAEYVLLRGLGRTHIFPGDDVGARNNLKRWLQLANSLDYEEVRRVLSPWRHYGGLVYFHLLLDRLAEASCLRQETM